MRNYAASLGLAILGTILLTEMRSRTTTTLVSQGMPKQQASHEAAVISQASQSGGGGASGPIPSFVKLDFAYATQTVLYVMAGIMAAAAVVAFVALKAGRQEEPGQVEVDAAAPTG